MTCSPCDCPLKYKRRNGGTKEASLSNRRHSKKDQSVMRYIRQIDADLTLPIAKYPASFKLNQHKKTPSISYESHQSE